MLHTSVSELERLQYGQTVECTAPAAAESKVAPVARGSSVGAPSSSPPTAPNTPISDEKCLSIRQVEVEQRLKVYPVRLPSAHSSEILKRPAQCQCIHRTHKLGRLQRFCAHLSI